MIESEDAVDREHGQRTGQRGEYDGPDCLAHVGHLQVSEAAVQEVPADDGAGDVSETVGRTEQDHDLIAVGCEDRSERRESDFHCSDAENDPRRRPGLFAGVEHSKLDQDQRVRNQRECRPAHSGAESFGLFGSEAAVTVERFTDLRTHEGQEHDDRNQRDHGQTRCDRQIVHDGRGVVGSSVAAQARHDRRQNRHSEHAVRELQEQPGLAVDGRAGFVGVGGDLGREDHAHLADQDVQDDGDGHAAELAQAVVETPQRLERDLLAAKRGDQAGCLHDDADGDADAEGEQLCIAHRDRIKRDLARSQAVDHEHHEDDDVVEYGSPGSGLEDLPGVQKRCEQCRQPVEQDRRQK